MALGVNGFGCEDALTHLMNFVWPNVFETSPHLVQAFMDAVDGMRVALGPMKVLSYVLQVSFFGQFIGCCFWASLSIPLKKGATLNLLGSDFQNFVKFIKIYMLTAWELQFRFTSVHILQTD